MPATLVAIRVYSRLHGEALYSLLHLSRDVLWRYFILVSSLVKSPPQSRKKERIPKSGPYICLAIAIKVLLSWHSRMSLSPFHSPKQAQCLLLGKSRRMLSFFKMRGSPRSSGHRKRLPSQFQSCYLQSDRSCTIVSQWHVCKGNEANCL